MLNRIRKYIKYRPIKNFVKIEGWLSFLEGHTLYSTAKKVGKDASIVEIGSWQGKSTYCMARGLQAGAKIYAIDPFNSDGEEDSKKDYIELSEGKDLLSVFQNNLKGYEDHIEVKKGYSNDFVNEINDIDFLFIDGDHSIEGCSYDFENYIPKVKNYGYVAIHDYYPDRKELGPTHVVEQIAGKDESIKTIGVFDTLWLGQKIENA